MTYLITCSKSKIIPSIFNPSSLNKLSYNDLLHETREELLTLTNIQLDWNYTLPAWQLYSGKQSRMYSVINKDCWENNEVNFKILSALFGWICKDDLVPNYNLQMTDKLNNNITVHNFWKSKNVLNKLVFQTDINLLSTNYLKAFKLSDRKNGTKPNQKFKGRGAQQGIWLNSQILNSI